MLKRPTKKSSGWLTAPLISVVGWHCEAISRSRIVDRRIGALIIIGFFVSASPMKGMAQSEPKPLPASVENIHRDLVKQLSGDQVKVLSNVYPDFRILALCSGFFSGTGHNELVLGVWKPVQSEQHRKREVHRVGLIWSKTTWEVHIIDGEIEKDEDLSRSFPMHWQYSLDDDGFVGEMKCGVESEFGKDSDLTYALGDKPFFDLKKMGLQKNKVVCFSTDDVYNNWDCVVYSPKDGRFRLWYQQAHAD